MPPWGPFSMWRPRLCWCKQKAYTQQLNVSLYCIHTHDANFLWSLEDTAGALVGKVKTTLVWPDKIWGGKSFCATQKSFRWYFWLFPPAFVLSVWREQLVWCNLEWSFFKAFTQEKLQELWGYSLALRNRKKASLHWQLDPRERWLPACLTGPLGLDEAETEEQSY